MQQLPRAVQRRSLIVLSIHLQHHIPVGTTAQRVTMPICRRGLPGAFH